MKETVMLLKDAGVDNVIVLTSSKLESVLKMVVTDGVDLVLSVVSPASGELLQSMEELRTRNGAHLCFIAHGGNELGMVTIGHDEDDKVKQKPSSLFPVDDSREPDSELSTMVEQYEFNQTSQYSSRITSIPVEAAALFPELCTEIVRQKINCEVGLLWSSLFRNKVNPGKFYELDLWRVLPMGETISKVSMRGSYLEKLIREHQDILFATGIEIDNGVCSVNGRLLKPNALYSVAMNNYLASGGGGYVDKSSSLVTRVKNTPWVLRDLVKTYLL